MRKSIFISSTYRDLISHRKEIWKRLQNLEIDILGMESFGARKSSPIKTCLEEVEKCDIYIGIISMSAGTIHPELKKSYTELEYLRAIELNKDIWIYLIDESEGNILIKNIDFNNSEYLVDFKNRLKNHTVDFFKNEKDLGIKIFNRIKQIVPKTKKTIKRPIELPCKIVRYNTKNSKRIIFASYMDQRLFEVFTCINDDNDEYGLLLPHILKEGKMVKSRDEDGLSRFDFQYINKRGFKTTIEGINYVYLSEVSSYDMIISKLLQNDVENSIIEDIIRELPSQNEEQKAWKVNLNNLLRVPKKNA